MESPLTAQEYPPQMHPSPPAKLEVMPFLKNLADVERVTRPSAAAGQRYNELSTAFFQGVNQVLNGADAAQVVPQTAQRIERIIA